MILGVTGNIASGKSLVAELLRRRGARVLSADQLAREIVAPGSALLAELAELFGAEVIGSDGGLNREILADIVFADEGARQRLNALLHPAIGRLAEERLAQLAASAAPLIVYEAPLLYEAGAEGRVDKVLVVTVSPKVQLERLCRRDRLDEEAASQRVAAQMPQADKVARADYLVDNSGSRAELEQRVERLWRELVGREVV